MVHLSSNSIFRDESVFDKTVEIYSIEFLNNISSSGVHMHTI